MLRKLKQDNPTQHIVRQSNKTGAQQLCGHGLRRLVNGINQRLLKMHNLSPIHSVICLTLNTRLLLL